MRRKAYKKTVWHAGAAAAYVHTRDTCSSGENGSLVFIDGCCPGVNDFSMMFTYYTDAQKETRVPKLESEKMSLLIRNNKKIRLPENCNNSWWWCVYNK